MSRIEQIIGEIEDYIDGCKGQTFSNTNIIVNKEEITELLVELRLQIPDEVKKYQKIISNQDVILDNAKEQANNIVSEANKMTEQLLDEHEIMQKAYATADSMIEEANRQAQEIVDKATAESNNIKLSSVKYTEDMLKSLQTIITHAMEGTQSRYDSLISTFQSNYNIVSSNLNELVTGISHSEPTIDSGQSVIKEITGKDGQ